MVAAPDPLSETWKRIADRSKKTLYLCFEAYPPPSQPKAYAIRSLSVSDLFTNAPFPLPRKHDVLPIPVGVKKQKLSSSPSDSDTFILTRKEVVPVVEDPTEIDIFERINYEGLLDRILAESFMSKPVELKEVFTWDDGTAMEDMGFGKFGTNLLFAGGQNFNIYSGRDEIWQGGGDPLLDYSKKVVFFPTTTTTTTTTSPVSVVTEMKSSKSIHPLVMEAYGRPYVLSQVINLRAMLYSGLAAFDNGVDQTVPSVVMDWRKRAFETYNLDTRCWESLPMPPFLGEGCRLWQGTMRFLIPDLGYAVIHDKIFISAPAKAKNEINKKNMTIPLSFDIELPPPTREVEKYPPPQYSCYNYDVGAREWAQSHMFAPHQGFTNQAFLFSDDILICTCVPLRREVCAYKLAHGKAVKYQCLAEDFHITKYTVSAYLAEIGEGFFCLVRSDLIKGSKASVSLILFCVERATTEDDHKFIDCKIENSFTYDISPKLMILELRGCCGM